MADDDDDDAFGEFTFASNQPSPVNSSSQIPVTTANDDWGDFNFVQSDHNLKSPQPQPNWKKINGALPLSLFGDHDDADDEKEEENKDDIKQVMPVARDDVKQLVSNSNENLGINDLIANLYGQTQTQQQQQQQTVKAVDNGNELDFTDLNSSVSKDPFSNSDSLSSFRLDTVADAAGIHGSDDDEGGWDFIDAFSDSKIARNVKVDKEPSEKTVSPHGLQGGSHGPIDLFASPNNGVFVESRVMDNNGFSSKPTTNYQNGFGADFKGDSVGTANESSSNPLGESDDFDDTFGEFETAFMEQPSTKKEVSEERFDPLGSHVASNRPVDLFAFPNGVSGGSHKENNGFDFSQSSVVQNGVASDLFSQTEWKETKDDSESQPPGVGADDENFGKFETTFPEDGSKLEGSDASSKNYKGAVPLSIFGIEEEPEVDSSLNLHHELFKSSTNGKHTRNQSSNLSINDILSDLYSQAEPISSANHEGNSNGNVEIPDSTGNEYSSHVVDDDNDDDDDDFNDGSWEFKDASASSQSRVEDQNYPCEKKMNNCMDFYSNLKDDLCVVARRHINDLKKAQSTATLAGEEMKVAALNKEIQEALEELHQNHVISTEIDMDDHSERVISLKQYVETLHEPEFQVLESEYHISRKLSLAESDLRTTIDLINHFTTVLKILKLAPKGEPANYVSLWVKVISVCSQELKHGTWIWKQSLEKNLRREILSELQGKQFIIALGEIYRTVVILEAAVKFYKPWILLSGADLEGIYGLLEECHSLWSTSGLEETIPVDSLLESIRHIRNLDETAIAKEVLSEEESQCRLSLLSPRVMPDMKMVIWNGDKYFVALANLWGNLISSEPPNFSIQVS